MRRLAGMRTGFDRAPTAFFVFALCGVLTGRLVLPVHLRGLLQELGYTCARAFFRSANYSHVGWVVPEVAAIQPQRTVFRFCVSPSSLPVFPRSSCEFVSRKCCWWFRCDAREYSCPLHTYVVYRYTKYVVCATNNSTRSGHQCQIKNGNSGDSRYTQATAPKINAQMAPCRHVRVA